jgi:acyl-coenzyme A synthetase/AMP-(fatty) acid ligase
VVNIYGPTEATAIATTYEARWQGDLGIAVPIGTVLPNTEVLVLDDHGQPVPVGVPGEIVLRGPTVARGYHGQPELTAQVFARDDGVRRYRTGDVGRWRTEGLLDFAGRIDDQVKVRGMRVEPGEVENVLAALPDVEAAIVTTHPDSTGAARLIAYVTLRNGTSSSSAEIRAALAETLPGHLVPSVVTILDAFPLTSSGKVDRSSLPAPAAVADLPFTAPRDPVERALANILASLLDVPQVGVHDDFFQLGGHSLLAMQFVADVRLKLGWQLRLTDVLNHPTIAGLAAVRREDPVERISRLPR